MLTHVFLRQGCLYITFTYYVLSSVIFKKDTNKKQFSGAQDNIITKGSADSDYRHIFCL